MFNHIYLIIEVNCSRVGLNGLVISTELIFNYLLGKTKVLLRSFSWLAQLIKLIKRKKVG